MTISLEHETTIGGHKYRISRVSAFDQMALASDYRDILVGLAMIRRDRPKDMSNADYEQGVQYIMTARVGMSPEIRERVMNTCFAAILRHSGVGWQPVLSGPGVLQFADIGLPEMVKLMYAFFEHNKLIDFFSESPSDSGGQTTANAGRPFPTEKTG